MVKNSTNINNMNSYLSPQITEHLKNTMTCRHSYNTTMLSVKLFRDEEKKNKKNQLDSTLKRRLRKKSRDLKL
jgi:hypothetical protein